MGTLPSEMITLPSEVMTLQGISALIEVFSFEMRDHLKNGKGASVALLCTSLHNGIPLLKGIR